jgi:hypothetical protein
MWCDGNTTPICSGFTISQMFLMPLGSRACQKAHGIKLNLMVSADYETTSASRNEFGGT